MSSSILTSLLYAPPSSLPPVNLSLPAIIRARAPYSDLGSEVRAVQASVPGRKVSTEAKLMEPLFPPATTSACTFEIGVAKYLQGGFFDWSALKND